MQIKLGANFHVKTNVFTISVNSQNLKSDLNMQKFYVCHKEFSHEYFKFKLNYVMRSYMI